MTIINIADLHIKLNTFNKIRKVKGVIDKVNQKAYKKSIGKSLLRTNIISVNINGNKQCVYGIYCSLIFYASWGLG